MAIKNVSLKNVITGTKQKYFIFENTSTGNTEIYIANIEKNDSDISAITSLGYSNTPIEQLTNISNIFVGDSRIKNMYNILDNYEDLLVRSFAYSNNKGATLANPEDFSDLMVTTEYLPKSVIGFKNSMYVLTNKLNTATYYSIKEKSILGNTIIENDEILKTPLYTAIFPSAEELLESNKTLSEFSEKYIPRTYVDGINYNHFLEYPTSLYPLFNENTLFANAIICKNHLGYDYSQHSEVSGNIKSNTETGTRKFNELRTYKRLITSGNDIYAVYSNDTSAITQPYNENNYRIIAVSAVETYPTSVSSTEFPNADNYATGTIEKVELLKSTNRFSNKNKHKANLYSIEINDLGLNSFINNDEISPKIKKVAQNIKKSINNGIRKLCKNTQPGNTQLFSIFYTGK